MEEIKENIFPIFDEIPTGWSIVKGALTAPCGYELIYNGKSLFSGERRCGLVKCKIEESKSEKIFPFNSLKNSIKHLPNIIPEKSVGICFSDEAEIPEKLNKLAREETKLRLLRDIAADITVCKLEGWDYKKYLLELQEEIGRFL